MKKVLLALGLLMAFSAPAMASCDTDVPAYQFNSEYDAINKNIKDMCARTSWMNWEYAAPIIVAASSHANNACLGAIQSITIAEATASKGILLNNFAVRFSTAITGNVTVYVFKSQPSGVCATDGAAFALTDANFLLVPPGGQFSLTPAAAGGGATQTTGANTQMQMDMTVDAGKKVWFALINTSGGAITPAANGLSYAAGGTADPY